MHTTHIPCSTQLVKQTQRAHQGKTLPAHAMLVAGLGAFLAVVAGVLASYDSKLRAFMAELAGEDGLATPGKAD